MSAKNSLFAHFSPVFVALLLFFSFAKSGTYLLLEKGGLPPKNQKNRVSDEEFTCFLLLSFSKDPQEVPLLLIKEKGRKLCAYK